MIKINAREAEALAARTLAGAFWNDPIIGHIYPNEAVRVKRLDRFFGLSWRATAPLGTCDVTAGNEAVAIWRPPGQRRIPRRVMLANAIPLVRAYGAAFPRVLDCLKRMEAVHPAQPHWYLMTIGTDPAKQGQGHARSLLETRLAQCDADGLPAYLESGTANNIPYYERFGFAALAEVAIPNGPSFWPMWRVPRHAP